LRRISLSLLDPLQAGMSRVAQEKASGTKELKQPKTNNDEIHDQLVGTVARFANGI